MCVGTDRTVFASCAVALGINNIFLYNHIVICSAELASFLPLTTPANPPVIPFAFSNAFLIARVVYIPFKGLSNCVPTSSLKLVSLAIRGSNETISSGLRTLLVAFMASCLEPQNAPLSPAACIDLLVLSRSSK